MPLFNYETFLSMNNNEVAKLLRFVAASYAIKDEKKYRFQIIAYQKAADLIEGETTQLKDLYLTKQLDKFPGIGKSMSSSLAELFEKGSVKHFDEVMKDIPKAVFPLLDIPSFGPKKAYKLVTAFKLKSDKTVVEDLLEIATKGRIAELPSFGEKSESDIITAIQEYKKGTTKSNRMVLPYAADIADKLVLYMKKNPHVKDISTLGSLRRMQSTIGDIDIAVASDQPKEVLEHFVAYPFKERVIEKGDLSASILISGGQHIDVMVQPQKGFGSLVQHFTGSKRHNVALREFALKQGFSVSEYGIKKKGHEKPQLFSKEEDVYKYLGMDWIPPEIRDNNGEIEKALTHDLPKLVSLSNIKGDLHIHSNYPIEPSHDLGADSMEDMVAQAKELKYEYIGFSEHNPSVSKHSVKEIYSILQKRKNKIERLKKSIKSVRVFNLLELDILANGTLALDDRALEEVDAVLVSIHSSFSMNKTDMTKRIINGLSHPKAKILSHPTGRLLNERPGYEVDWDVLFDFVKNHNKALEINSWPTRLDLPDDLVKTAQEYGIKFIINTDSHALSHMNNMRYGVSVARRGWCTKESILNTLPFKEFSEWLLNDKAS